MSKQLIALANKVLSELAAKAVPWEQGLTAAFGDKATTVKLNVERQLAKVNLLPSGLSKVYVGSIVDMGELVPEVLPSEEKLILELLKEKNRIIQLGPGRGKAVFLPSAGIAISLETEVTKELIDPLDPNAMQKALTTLLEDLEVLRERYIKQQANIAELEEKLEKLQREHNIRYLTTWS